MSDESSADLGTLSRRAALTLGLGVGATALLGTASASAAGPHTVNYSYQRQATQSWCSAASSRIALSARGVLPTQKTLAAELGLRGGAGLQDPTLIAKVLNKHLGRTGAAHRYVFRIAPYGELKERLRMRVKQSIGAGYPVVINMNRVAGDTYSAGHYVAIVGYKPGAYKISDPDEPARSGAWYADDDIVAWNKLNRFTAFA